MTALLEVTLPCMEKFTDVHNEKWQITEREREKQATSMSKGFRDMHIFISLTSKSKYQKFQNNKLNQLIFSTILQLQETTYTKITNK